MYHLARKAIPHADKRTVDKAAIPAPNGIKLESFIIDVFEAAERMAVLEVQRQHEFSPVKNKPGSAADSQRGPSRRHRRGSGWRLRV